LLNRLWDDWGKMYGHSHCWQIFGL